MRLRAIDLRDHVVELFSAVFFVGQIVWGLSLAYVDGWVAPHILLPPPILYEGHAYNLVMFGSFGLYLLPLYKKRAVGMYLFAYGAFEVIAPLSLTFILILKAQYYILIVGSLVAGYLIARPRITAFAPLAVFLPFLQQHLYFTDPLARTPPSWPQAEYNILYTLTVFFYIVVSFTPRRAAG